jgi:hypothetical protein
MICYSPVLISDSSFQRASSAAKGLPLCLARACFLTLPEFECKRKWIPVFRRAVIFGHVRSLLGLTRGPSMYGVHPVWCTGMMMASPGRVAPGVVRGWSSRLTATALPGCIHPGSFRGWSSRLTVPVSEESEGETDNTSRSSD